MLTAKSPFSTTIKHWRFTIAVVVPQILTAILGTPHPPQTWQSRKKQSIYSWQEY
jgi:hypothetical protein